jgi:hypothetical protein
MIKVLQLPAGINSEVTNNTGMPKKRRLSVQEAEQEQVTGQARLIAEDRRYVNNLICYYEIFTAANFLQILEV